MSSNGNLFLILSVIANVFLLGFYMSKSQECDSYKEKAEHWYSQFYKLAKIKEQKKG